MTTVYWICLIAGILIPLLSLVCDFFDGIGDLIDLDIDFPGLDFGDFHIALLPISVNSICGALLTFGALGLILSLNSPLQLLIINIIAIGGGYLIGICLQTIIQKLKKVEHPAWKEEEILLFDAVVIHTIPANGMGSISISLPESSSISYPAKSTDGNRIKQDEKVIIDSIENGIAFVKEKNYLEKKYETPVENKNQAY